MNNETKNLKYVIGFFLVLSIVASYYIGFMSAKLGLSAPFIPGTITQNPSAAAPEPKLVEEVAPVQLTGDEVFKGDKNANMVLVTFTDFQCPFCAKFHPTLDALFEANKGSKLVFKHFPLNFHQYAKDFATMFECVAKNQGNDKGVSFAEDLFAKNLLLQGQITSTDGLNIFQTFGLSEDTLNNCKNDSSITSKITNDYNDGVSLGINGTPALYIINTKTSKAVRINGALDQATLQTEFDKIK
jgi:protein-disulfide isomerase